MIRKGGIEPGSQKMKTKYTFKVECVRYIGEMKQRKRNLKTKKNICHSAYKTKIQSL